MINRFNVLPVRVKDKRGIVAGVILRPIAWGTVILTAGFKRSEVDCFHHIFTTPSERQMHPGHSWRSFRHPEAAARLGWLLGNLHFRVAVVEGAIHAPDDPAVRQLLEREHIHYHVVEAVFRPLGGGHGHGHSHGH